MHICIIEISCFFFVLDLLYSRTKKDSCSAY
ncbi:hypothetical protein GLYMA_01G101233v4 [Glycine max]|nr:hypothetical protein GLYMA_01G101233v4 [Glycine max]KAH1162461.1 hypothetical protein GYH30_001090 [Glycine max]